MNKEYLVKFAKEMANPIRLSEFYVDNMDDSKFYSMEDLDNAKDVYDCLILWLKSIICSNFERDFSKSIDFNALFG